MQYLDVMSVIRFDSITSRPTSHSGRIAIQKDERYLVTADKGFGDIRTYPPGTHHGILLLRPDEDGIAKKSFGFVQSRRSCWRNHSRHSKRH